MVLNGLFFLFPFVFLAHSYNEMSSPKCLAERGIQPLTHFDKVGLKEHLVFINTPLP